MGPEQAALTAAFPQFIDTIENTLTAQDYHIMVVDTDAETRCTQVSCADPDALALQTCVNAPPEDPGYACQDIFEDCDSVRGAGVLHPAGEGASNMPCPVDGGNRYITQGQQDLSQTFQCIATVGLAGHPSERPLDGIVEALSPGLNGVGACNEGFLREDAILVITFISDDPNVEDLNDSTSAYNAVVAAKNGDEDRIVVLGLIPPCQSSITPDVGTHWSQFISMFGTRGIKGSVCSDDYNQFFLDAVGTIDATCDANPT